MGVLTECQSHFGQTAVLSVQLLAAEVRGPSVIRAEVVATKVDTVEAAISYCCSIKSVSLTEFPFFPKTDVGRTHLHGFNAAICDTETS